MAQGRENEYNNGMSAKPHEQYSFNFEGPDTPRAQSRLDVKHEGRGRKLTREETERLESLIQEALAHINDPTNKKDEILRMSSEADKREIAKSRVWLKFKRQPTVEEHDHMLD